MKKIIYTTLFSLSLFITFGQDNKVGINTDEPQETVDVNGTMRIKDVTGSNNTTSLLGVDENGKVVKMATKTENFTPFIYKRYKVNTNPRRRDSKARANNIALGIDANNYVAILVQAALVKRNYTYGNSQRGAFPLASARLNGSEYSRRIKINGGTLKNDSDQDLLGGGQDYNNQVVAFGIPSQNASLTKRNGDYYFSADYPNTDFAGNENYSWVISVLVINRNWTLTQFSTL